MSHDSWNPGQYDKFKEQRSQPFFDLMNLLEPRADAVIADLGCGTGELTAELHRHLKAKRTLGIDSSAQMLAKASLHSNPAANGLVFENEAIEKWEPRERFGVIFSNAALQWCSEHRQLFARLKGFLNSGGQLAVQMPMNHDYPTHVLAAQMSREKPWAELLGPKEGDKYDKQEQMLSPEDYSSLLFRLGFRDQKVFLRVYGHELESREGVIEWVKGTLLTHFKSRLSEGDYGKFLGEYRTRLFERLPDDRPFFYPFKRILIWARLG